MESRPDLPSGIGGRPDGLARDDCGVGYRVPDCVSVGNLDDSGVREVVMTEPLSLARLEEIRERWPEQGSAGGGYPAALDVWTLLAEVERLTAQRAVVLRGTESRTREC